MLSRNNFQAKFCAETCNFLCRCRSQIGYPAISSFSIRKLVSRKFVQRKKTMHFSSVLCWKYLIMIWFHSNLQTYSWIFKLKRTCTIILSISCSILFDIQVGISLSMLNIQKINKLTPFLLPQSVYHHSICFVG